MTDRIGRRCVRFHGKALDVVRSKVFGKLEAAVPNLDDTHAAPLRYRKRDRSPIPSAESGTLGEIIAGNQVLANFTGEMRPESEPIEAVG
jgi:hypothetical protein